MRKTFLVVLLLQGLVIASHAQTRPEPRVSLSIVADSVKRDPVFGRDGIVRDGSAQTIVTATGNVVVRVNDIEMLADRAAWRWGSRDIELSSGGVSVWVGLPGVSHAYHFENRQR